MSDLRVTNLKGRTAGSAPTLPDGAVVTGVTTSTSFHGSCTSLTNLNESKLDQGTVPDARFPATLPAVSGENLTNLPASGDSNDITACLFI